MQRNVLKWACLLHEVSKRGSPTIKGRDFVYAFRSAATTLRVFERLGVLEKGEQRSDWEHVHQLLAESNQPLPAIWRSDFRHG